MTNPRTVGLTPTRRAKAEKNCWKKFCEEELKIDVNQKVVFELPRKSTTSVVDSLM